MPHDDRLGLTILLIDRVNTPWLPAFNIRAYGLLPGSHHEDSTTLASGAPSTAGAAQTKSVALLHGVMGDSITVDHEEGDATDLQIVTLALDNRRQSVASSREAVATRLKPETLQKILETGMGIREKLGLSPGKYEIKFAVRDNFSGLIGTVSLPLDLR